MSPPPPHFRGHSDPEAWPGAQQSQLLRWWWWFYNNMHFWGYPIQVVGVPAWDNAKLRGGSSCLTPWSSLSPKSVEVPIFPGPPRGCKATPECPSFVLGDAWPAPAVSRKDQLRGWWSRPASAFTHSGAAGEIGSVPSGESASQVTAVK